MSQENKHPLVSVIVPIYNVEKYLTRCLDSLVNQTYTNLEIICVNDGSPDNSKAIAQKYCVDHRVTLIDQPNKGLSGARNTGLSNATGDYIVFVDSDDWLYERCIETALAATEDNFYDVIVWPYTKVFQHRTEKQFIYSCNVSFNSNEEVKRGFYSEMLGPSIDMLRRPHTIDSKVTACSKMYKTKIISDAKFKDTQLIGTEDLLFNAEVIAKANTLKYIDIELYYYNKVNESSLTSSYKPKLLKQWAILHSELELLAVSQGVDKANVQRRYACSIIGLGLNVLCARESFLWSRSKITQILCIKKYSNALQSLDLSNMPLHWKVFFFCAKHKLSTPLTILLFTIHRIILK